jgi:AraC family transcriptional regulator of adaptative response / DNA-3-methyladenine glycosylase II
LGDQRSAAATRQAAGRLVAAHGTPVGGLGAFGLSHTFPEPAILAAADLSSIDVNRDRATTIRKLAAAVAGKSITLDRAAGYLGLSRSLSTIAGTNSEIVLNVALRLGERLVPARTPADVSA